MCVRLCVTIAAAISATVATAADLPLRATPPAVAPPTIFDWTGFYVGFNAGYGFDADLRQSNVSGFKSASGGGIIPPVSFYAINNLTPLSKITPRAEDHDGFVGGGQAGYNFQLSPDSGFVFGLEADFQYADLNRRGKNDAYFIPGLPPPNSFFLVENRSRQGLDYFGTLRGRVGYAFDRVLVYATGGLAYGDSDRRSGATSLTGGFPIVALSGASRGERIETGYAVGGGLEYALSDHLTAKLEGLSVAIDKGKRTDTEAFLLNPTGGVSPAVQPVALPRLDRKSLDFALVRTGLNYKF